MDSSESPTDGAQEGSAYNGHFGCTCYHPLFVFNQLGDLERCALRSGNVHSAASWREVLEPVVARYRGTVKQCCFRGDAAFANPEIYEFLEAESIGYAIRLPANRVLQDKIGHLLKRPVGRPPQEVRRYYSSFRYQAGSWNKPRRVVAKVEWHPGELYPRVGFIVTNLARPAERVVAFYNQRGTAEQCIKEGKGAIKWTRLSCHSFAANAVRLQLHALAYNLGNCPVCSGGSSWRGSPTPIWRAGWRFLARSKAWVGGRPLLRTSRRSTKRTGSSTPSRPLPGPRRCSPISPAIHTASPSRTAGWSASTSAV